MTVPLVQHKEDCDQCNAGYTGRHLVNEIFLKDPESERMIAQGISGNDIRAHQFQTGSFQDLWDDGIRLVKNGITSLEVLETKINPLHVARAQMEFSSDLQQRNKAASGMGFRNKERHSKSERIHEVELPRLLDLENG